MGGMAAGAWREPSLRDVAVETAMFWIYGPGPPRRRTAVAFLVTLVVMALVLPKVGSDAWQLNVLVAPLLVTITVAYRAGRRQRILGRDASHVATAVLIAFLGSVVLGALFVAISLVIGPAPEDALFVVVLEQLFPKRSTGSLLLFAVVFFGGLIVVAVVASRRSRPAREAYEAALQRQAKIERTARAAAAGQKAMPE